jgi:NAD+ kinase
MRSRGMVTSDKRVIKVELTRNARRTAYVSVDGGKALRMNIGDTVTIRKANRETKLFRLKDRSFYDVVRMKFR